LEQVLEVPGREELRRAVRADDADDDDRQDQRDRRAVGVREMERAALEASSPTLLDGAGDRLVLHFAPTCRASMRSSSISSRPSSPATTPLRRTRTRSAISLISS